MMTACEALEKAIDYAEHGDIPNSGMWLAIATELRLGAQTPRIPHVDHATNKRIPQINDPNPYAALPTMYGWPVDGSAGAPSLGQYLSAKMTIDNLDPHRPYRADEVSALYALINAYEESRR